MPQPKSGRQIIMERLNKAIQLATTADGFNELQCSSEGIQEKSGLVLVVNAPNRSLCSSNCVEEKS